MRHFYLIRTRYCSPSDRHGSRVSATHVLTRKRIRIPWLDELSAEENHKRAAQHMLRQYPAHHGIVGEAQGSRGERIWVVDPCAGLVQSLGTGLLQSEGILQAVEGNR